MSYAQYQRRMQFEAGPQQHTFYSCQQCLSTLEKGDISCFLKLKDEPVRPIALNLLGEQTCDLCREP